MWPPPPARAARARAVGPGGPGAALHPREAGGVGAPTAPRHAEADRIHSVDAPIDGAVHHGMEDLLHPQLALGLEVGASGAGLADHAAVAVGEAADGLGSAP